MNIIIQINSDGLFDVTIYQRNFAWQSKMQ